MIRLLVVTVLVLAVAAWLGYEITRARRRRASPPGGRRPTPPPSQRVTDEQLRQRARSLRDAVDTGHVSLDEAVGSLMRYSGNALTVQQARELLDR